MSYYASGRAALGGTSSAEALALAAQAAKQAGATVVDAAGKGTLASPMTYGQFAKSIATDVMNTPSIKGALSPASRTMLDMGGVAAGTIIGGIAAGESGSAVAEQLAWLLADIVIGVVKDVVKDALAVVPVLGSIVNIVIDAASGAARIAAVPGKSGSDQDKVWEQNQQTACITWGNISPGAYAGKTLPAHFFVLGGSPKLGWHYTSALGRVINAIVFPSQADLEAIAWYAISRKVRVGTLTALAQKFATVSGFSAALLLPHAAEMATDANSCTYSGLPSNAMKRLLGGSWQVWAAMVAGQVATSLPTLGKEVLATGCVSGRIVDPPAQRPGSAALIRSTAAPHYAVPANELKIMQKLVLSISSQGMAGSGGTELWPLLMDALLHQLKSGQINDAALSILASRHSEANCFDYNPAGLSAFYGLMDTWNEQMHPIFQWQFDAAAKDKADLLAAAAAKAQAATVAKVLSALSASKKACSTAKGTWDTKKNTCTTTRSGVVWSPQKLAFVAKPLFVVKAGPSPVALFAIGAAVVGGVAWMVKHRRRASA